MANGSRSTTAKIGAENEIPADPQGRGAPAGPEFPAGEVDEDNVASPPKPVSPDLGRLRIGERLLQLGLISKDQLDVALHEKERHPGKLLGSIFVEFGFITDQVLTSLLAETTGFDRFDAASTLFDPDAVASVPKEVAVQYKVLPISTGENRAVVAMADPYDVMAMDQLRRYFPRGVRIEPRVASAEDIVDAVDRVYGYEMSIDGIVRELETGEFDTNALVAGEEETYTHPVVRLVNAILLDAVKLGASDIHFEPEDLFIRLRYRIDGVLRQVRAFHKTHWPAISHRLKIIAGMNIADRLNPQDGRLSMRLGAREIDFRVSALPTVAGENIVLRVLDKAKALLALDQLGFGDHARETLEKIMLRPDGIIIVTGPTGSGKTTTLYAILSSISSPQVNIMTLEDPVEYDLPLIRQTQIRENTGLSFGEGIRAILRQDPDIVFVGEVRDPETAQMALRAAMTGHQVYTTLHTNDALAALPRLIDLGLQPSVLAGNIIGIVAQRLVRKLCTKCRVPRDATMEECRLLGADPWNPPTVHEAEGCEACGHTGHRGRIAIAEVIYVDDGLDDLIARGAVRAEVRAYMREAGFKTMAEDGLERVTAGDISVESLVGAVDLSDRL